MTGRVDESGRALVPVILRPASQAEPVEADVWVDTGFTGELVLPKNLIDRLELVPFGVVEARLADGSKVGLDSFACQIEWLGTTRNVEVIAGTGPCPLLGVGLLNDRRLVVDYRSRTIEID